MKGEIKMPMDGLAEKLLHIKCGDTLYVFTSDKQTEVWASVMKKMSKTGHAAYMMDGRQMFIRHEPIFYSDRTGSDCYEWHQDGDRCKHEKRLYTIFPDGTKHYEVLDYTWRKL